ncbi:MAG TPA: hypothetical protein DCP91_13695 [Eggerthellaceae bacterium]|nr:hypothetical protein [Eggerthellaceae bacterium]
MTAWRERAFSAVLACVLGLTVPACIIQIGTDRLPAIGPLSATAIMVIAALVVAAIAFPCALFVLRRGPGIVERTARHNPLPWLPLTLDARSIAICTGIIFLFWIPCLVLQYPAAANTDAMSQIYQFQTPAPTLYSGGYVDAEFVDHHPVFDTLLYGSFVWVGDALFGSQNAGLFLLALVQSAFTAWMLALSCCYLERLAVPKVFRLVTLAFFALVPLFGFYAATMLKDSTFSAIYVLWTVLYLEAFRTRGKALGSWRRTALFALATLLCFVTKKTGVYVLVPGMLVMLVAYRGYWKQLAVCIAAPLLVFQGLVPAVLYPAIGGVAPGGNEEVFGTLYQQVITVVRESDDLTADERSAVDAVLDVDAAVEAYRPTITDQVKDQRRLGTQASDYAEFLKAYLSIGLRHPGEYTWTICRLNGSFLAPGKAITYYHTCEFPEANTRGFAQAKNADNWHYTWYKPEPIKTWAKQVDTVYTDAVSTNPLLAFLLGRGLYTGWIPIICCLLACARDKRYAIVFVPVALSLAVLIIGPTSSARYALPLFYTAPLMLGTLCHALSSGSHSPDSQLPK